MSENYQSYANWKKWSWCDYEKVPQWMRRYFAGEVSRLNLPSNSRILEIGFGQGEFMEWARAKGYKVCGLEIIDELVDKAKAAGFEAAMYNITSDQEGQLSSQPTFLEAGGFDVIIAFDVVEHLTAEEFQAFLRFSKQMLAAKGSILLRFPNGGSPFGLRLQHGDNTHRMTLTETQLTQMTVGGAFEVVFCGNAYRVVGDGKCSWLARLAFLFRNMIERFVGLVYFMRRIPLDPALTAILKHQKI